MMNIYEVKSMGERVHGNEYVGRGIVIGKTEDGTKAAVAYFIMGRSENSRNRIFKEEANCDGRIKASDVTIYPFDESKVEDPSLIIYSPIMTFKPSDEENPLVYTIVTNGDQTSTVHELFEEKDKAGKVCCRTFENALGTRKFEPDAPNLTPRISGIVNFDTKAKDFDYKLSILKSGDESGTVCNRYTFDYEPIDGLGHFIHTYVCDGNPIPTFQGEPERVSIPNEIDEFFEDIWNNLDGNNKISLYVRYIDLETGEVENRMINKNK